MLSSAARMGRANASREAVHSTASDDGATPLVFAGRCPWRSAVRRLHGVVGGDRRYSRADGSGRPSHWFLVSCGTVFVLLATLCHQPAGPRPPAWRASARRGRRAAGSGAGRRRAKRALEDVKKILTNWAVCRPSSSAVSSPDGVGLRGRAKRALEEVEKVSTSPWWSVDGEAGLACVWFGVCVWLRGCALACGLSTSAIRRRLALW
jgi:hypothetical protein